MVVIRTLDEMRSYSARIRKEGKTMGLVPTMGCLHEGHLSLVRAARQDCDKVVLSIYVNPAQFGPGEDLEKYPRDTDRDISMAGEEGVDVVFLPDDEDMYPEGYGTFVEVDGVVTKVLCGASRPGHFKGVCTVVTKLLNVIRPDKSYFGQKDAQQSAVIRKMVEDLDIDTRVIVLPIIREDDGLAMSSRNKYLTPEERALAPVLYGSLLDAETMISEGETHPARIREKMSTRIEGAEGVKLDYIEIVDAHTLEKVEKAGKNTLIAVAAYVGDTRLIDNIIIDPVVG